MRLRDILPGRKPTVEVPGGLPVIGDPSWHRMKIGDEVVVNGVRVYCHEIATHSEGRNAPERKVLVLIEPEIV